MFLPILILIISLIFTPTHSIYFDNETEAAIDILIQDTYTSINHVPGLSLAIVSGDPSEGDLLVKGYGFSDIQTGQAVNADTIFAIGSITKSFTATLVVKTLNQLYPQLGESALDTPIRTLFPQYNFTLIDRYRSESVTFRDLLSHRTCLTPEFLGVVFQNFEGIPDFVYRHRYAPEACQFRSQFLYNNGPVILAGDIIAAMMNTTAHKMMSEFFLDLGMTSSSLISEDVDYENLPNMTKMYYRKDGQTLEFKSELIKRISPAVSSGSILSTANDMRKYMMFHLNYGRVGSRQIVPEVAMKWLSQNSMHVPFNFQNGFGDIGYALGFFLGVDAGFKRIHHGGYVAPFLSMLSFYPELNVSIFTTQNGPGTNDILDARLHRLHSQIFAVLRNSEPEISKENYEKKSRIYHDLKFNPTISEQLVRSFTPAQIAGKYGNPTSGDFLIYTNTTVELGIQFGKWGSGILVKIPTTNNTYKITWMTEVVQDFYASGPSVPEFLIDFQGNGNSIEKATIIFVGVQRFEFQKNFDMSTYPSQPWKDEKPVCENGGASSLLESSICFVVIFTILSNLNTFYL